MMEDAVLLLQPGAPVVQVSKDTHGQQPAGGVLAAAGGVLQPS